MTSVLVLDLPMRASESTENEPADRLLLGAVNGSKAPRALPGPSMQRVDRIEVGATIDLPEGAVAKCTGTNGADRGTWRVERSDGSLVHTLPGNSVTELREWAQLAHEGGRFLI